MNFITSETDLSFCPSSALRKLLHSLLCACFRALNMNRNPAPVADVILFPFLSGMAEIDSIGGMRPVTKIRSVDKDEQAPEQESKQQDAEKQQADQDNDDGVQHIDEII